MRISQNFWINTIARDWGEIIMDKTQSLIAMARRLLISHTGMPAVTEIPSDSDGYPLMLAYECARANPI
jgi:hypothetical protein